MSESFFQLLQLNDATFPIGSYTFSWGLETFVQQEYIHDRQSTQEYILSELYTSFMYGELLSAKCAFESCRDNNKLRYLDKIYSSSKSAVEIREGSRKLAGRFFKIIESFTGDLKLKEITYLPEYFATAYGFYCGKKEFDLKESLDFFIYSQMSSRITTAVKLVPLSQTDGQKILFEISKEFPYAVKKCLSLTQDDLCRSSPGLDIRSMQHEFLYTRLYSN